MNNDQIAFVKEISGLKLPTMKINFWDFRIPALIGKLFKYKYFKGSLSISSGNLGNYALSQIFQKETNKNIDVMYAQNVSINVYKFNFKDLSDDMKKIILVSIILHEFRHVHQFHNKTKFTDYTRIDLKRREIDAERFARFTIRKHFDIISARFGIKMDLEELKKDKLFKEPLDVWFKKNYTSNKGKK